MSANQSAPVILVVDDEPITRTLLATNLEEAGYVVREAENGHQALERVREQPVDVVLLDLLMPVMDGFQTLKRLKADTSLRRIPVIIVSSAEDMESVLRCLELGAVDHLSKPCDPLLLQARVRGALAVRQLSEQARQKIGAENRQPAEAASRAGMPKPPGTADEVAEPPSMGIMGFLRCLLYWMRPYKRQMLRVGVLLVVSKLIAAAFPLAFKFITDYALIPQNLQALAVILAVLAVAEFVSAATDIGRDYFYSRFSAKILNDLRFDMFRHLQHLSMRFYGRVSGGDITARFTTDLASVDNAITVCLQPVVCQVVMIVFCLVFLFALEWRLALLASLGLALSLRGERLVEPKADAAGVRMKVQQAKIASVLQENVQAQPVVKMFCLQSMLIQRFKHHMIDFYRTAARACFLAYLTSRVPSRLISFCSLLVIASGALLVYVGSLTLGELVSFQILLGELDVAAAELSWGLPQLLQASAGMERITGLLREPVDVTDASDATPLPVPEKEIVLANVRFGYAPGSLNLKDVSLRIPARQSVLLVGPSGCGKSTVLNLLMRFYDPLSGSVSIDGHDLRTVTQESLRKHMGVVLQENFLFNTTIRENMLLADPEATDEDIEAAARAAEIHDAIMKMPDGYNTIVGERGGKLSGGQRQRIAIARAILCRPSVLLLDEATSALDPVSAASINLSLERLGRGRTVIAVTHRLESAPSADGIYVFREGGLCEQGRHDDLLARNGLYAQLWKKQTGFTLSEDGIQAGVETARLRQVPILEELDDETLERVSGLFATEHFEPHRLVVQQGDPGDKFYIIVRGRVSVLQAPADGPERQIDQLEVGDYFGEVALLKRIPRTASVRTLSPCVLLSLQREHFLRLVAANRPLREKLEVVTASRFPSPISLAPSNSPRGG